ncbi:MAG TPA: TonB-dependent receptor [Steroidobacteraceae bacterium]|nr:TonB-dependent receptor [Steroidobacteraceae bacterium]
MPFSSSARSPVAAAVIGILGSTTSHAQSVTAGGGTADTALEEVTVTARRRPENVLDVPYNISVVAGQSIEDDHVLDTAELMRSVPGVSVVDRGDRNASVLNGIRIRGLNVDSSALGDYAVSAAATVSTYVNDTPIFANFLLTDIDRVEVLKGPQGTLYGSGAIGGTVRYILRDPELGTFGGAVSATGSKVSSSDSVGGSGTFTLNVPLGDTSAVRFTVTHNQFPGDTTYRNVYVLGSDGVPVPPAGGTITSPGAVYRSVKDADFSHQTYGRAAFKWKPDEKLDVTLSVTGQTDRFGGRRGTTLGSDGFGVPYEANQIGAVALEPASRDVYLAALEATLDLGFATLTSSTSRYNNHGEVTSDNTGFYAQNGWWSAFYYNYPRPLEMADRSYGDAAVIEELRLASKPGKVLDYVVGAYYQNQSLYSTQDSVMVGFKQWWDAAFPDYADAVLDDVDFRYRQREHFRDAALYGELTFHVTPDVEVTGGARAFRDRDAVDEYQTAGLYTSIFNSASSSGVNETNRSIFKGNVSWRFAPDNRVYATVAQGYRRGGSNGVPTTGYFAESPAWLSYRPDTDVDYEVGFKGQAADITYNADVFYVDWKNPQINTATTNWGFFAVQNVEKAVTKGVELQMASHIGPAFRYSLGYTYTQARLAADAVSADGAYLINTSGARLPGAPQQQINVAADYRIALGKGALTLHSDAYRQSETQDTLFSSNASLNTVPAPNPYAGQPKFYYPLAGFWLWNASATYAYEKWTGTVWVKNITNAQAFTGVYTEAYMGTSPAQNFYGNDSKALNALPRTIGVTLSLKF